MITRVLVSFLAAGFCFLTGCLEFGKDTEVLGPNITASHLQQVSSLTGIQFPEGTIGLAYYYLGSGIDDALAAKLVIPQDKKDTFLQNEIFQKGSTNSPNIQIGKLKPWWKINDLTDRTDRTIQLPQSRFVECTLGSETGKWVVYVSWISM